jgi:hypothetical protein
MKNNYRKQLFKERKEVGDMFGKKKVAIMSLTTTLALALSLFLIFAIQAGDSGIIKTKMLLIVETTSDWTRIAFNGLSIEEVHTYTITHGKEHLHYSHPTTITYTWIDITKKRQFDTNYVRIEFPLKVLISNATVRIDITKGDAGYTTISLYDRKGDLIETFTNTKTGQDFADWLYQAGVAEVDPGWGTNLAIVHIPSEKFR